MRILFFSRDYTTHDHRFLSALAKTGHQVFYLRLEQRGHSLEDRALPPEIEHIQWAGGQKPATFQDGPGLLIDLKRVIRKIKPDLVQAGPIQRSAFLAALAGFHPLVTMSWGYDLIFDAERNHAWSWATRFTLHRTDLFIGDCDTIRHKATTFGMRPDRIVTFPWGIDLNHFSPHPSLRAKRSNPPPSSSNNQSFTLLSTRGWESIYGVDVIARAFVIAAQQRPKLHLIMLGNGSLAGKLRQIFLQGGVDEQVHCPGQVSQADLPHYYRSADLYISASHSDGTSISLLEAMACGKPVLVSDIPGNREWVTPGENGWWFPDGDANALAQAILNAVEQRDQLSTMGRAARHLAEQRADWEINFQQMLKAYETIQ
jgi:L-malate glycosyltransferase